jgi:hypothetical protein
MCSRWARIGTRWSHRVRRRCSPWALGTSPRCPPLELAVTQRRLISRAGEQPRSVAAMGAGCVHRSRSRHVAVRRSQSPQLDPLAASTGLVTQRSHAPPAAAKGCLAAAPPVAAVAPKSLARVAGLSASSPDRRPLRRCHFGSRHSPPLVALAGLMTRRLAPGLRAAVALPPLELLAAERGLPPLL